MAAAVDLDLSFSAEPDLAPELRQAAGAWLDPLDGAECWQQLLSEWLAQLASELRPELRAPAYSLGLLLVGDAEIASLNESWRGQSGSTDVLAFAAQEEGLEQSPPMPLPEPLELGDIVISVDTAARQAPEHGHNLERELLFLASHGLLHLLGWDHPDEASLAAMLDRQERLLANSSNGGRVRQCSP
ncbi:MAG: rRNA maturation RNase YbeY [Prochlorococcaceae cyanobacterium]